jgi:serine/threonine-protein kinase RsbW
MAMSTEVRMSAQTLRVPWEMSSAVQVRRTLVSDLRRRGVDLNLVDEAEIVVSELFANAVRHAKALPDGMIRVNWAVRAGVVEVAVTDGGGPTTPRPAPPSMWSTDGRGLRIVRSLAHEWGVVDDDGGRTVWVSLGGPSLRQSL